MVWVGVVGVSRYASLRAAMVTVNDSCTAVFVAEMVLKLLAMGPAVYAQDSFNVLDGTIVVVSVLELGLKSLLPPSVTGLMMLLKTFRLLRLFKLARGVKSVRILLSTMLAAVMHVRWMALLMCVPPPPPHGPMPCQCPAVRRFQVERERE